MPEIQAAIGCAQVKKLPEFVAKRRQNAERLTKILANAKNLQLPVEPKGYESSWYLYTVRLVGATRERRDEIVQELRQREIGAEVYYVNPVHLMSYYSKFQRRRLPETESASDQVFSLPVHPGVASKQIDFVGKSVVQLLR